VCFRLQKKKKKKNDRHVARDAISIIKYLRSKTRRNSASALLLVTVGLDNTAGLACLTATELIGSNFLETNSEGVSTQYLLTP
jgi:hypothetical protein